MMDAHNIATLQVNNLQESAKGITGAAQMFSLRKPKAMTEAQMDAVARDFESLFISQMLGQMFGDSVGDSLFGSEETKEIYKTMMMKEYGEMLTASGGIGIASYVKRELLTLQEVVS